MKLANAATYFNKTPCSDAYTGTLLFHGQLDVYDDSKRDGLTAQRRMLEVAPGTAIPPRRTVEFAGQRWLIGVQELDQFRGRTIREKYVLHQAEGLAEVRTLRQRLEGSAGTDAYAARLWVKAEKETEISSRSFNHLNLYFSRAEPVEAGQIVGLGGRDYFIRDVYPGAAGHLVAESEELELGAEETGTAVGGLAWDPIRQEYAGDPVPVKVIRLRWQTSFEYFSQATKDFERGDMQAATLSAADTGTEIILADGKWRVQAVQIRGGVRFLHLRRSI